MLDDGLFGLAVCCVVIREGKVLAVSRPGSKTVFCLPGGKVEQGESLLAAIDRELFEETCIFADHFTPIFAKLIPKGKDGRQFVTTCFIATVQPGQEPKPEKGFALKWLNMSELARMPAPFGPFNKRVMLKLVALGLL